MQQSARKAENAERIVFRGAYARKTGIINFFSIRSRRNLYRLSVLKCTYMLKYVRPRQIETVFHGYSNSLKGCVI